jgi:hypothetical protein
MSDNPRTHSGNPHVHCDLIAELAYERGVQIGRQLERARTATTCEHIATSYAEINATWRSIGYTTYVRRIAERLESLRATTPGPWDIRRGDHPGGPVDWVTGQPLAQLDGRAA